MSAGMHVFVAPNVPLQCSVWPQLRYYSSIAGAIVLEDLVILGYKAATSRLVREKKPEPVYETSFPKDSGSTERELLVKNTGGEMRKRVAKALPLSVQGPTVTGKSKEQGNCALSQTPGSSNSGDPMREYFKVLGYFWVFAFEVWSTSKCLYITQQCNIKLSS